MATLGEYKLLRLKLLAVINSKIEILEEIVTDYPQKTCENVLQQLKAIRD